MLPTFHDGHLNGLAVFERTATLSIAPSNGASWRIDLSGVRHLKADDFREGNIILSFEVTTGAEPPRELVEALLPGPDDLVAQEYHEQHRAYIDGLVAQILTGSLTLVSLSPSYGCEPIAVCEAVSGEELR